MSNSGPGYDPNVYKNAKSTRASWANALIVAAVIFIVAIIMTATSGIGVSWWFFLATLIVLVVAGILALTGIGKSKS